jgi:hypothetical protein
MQEIVWYALSHGVTRPVPGEDTPLWFTVLLFLGLIWASSLIGSGVIQWCRGVHWRT